MLFTYKYLKNICLITRTRVGISKYLINFLPFIIKMFTCSHKFFFPRKTKYVLFNVSRKLNSFLIEFKLYLTKVP